MLLKGVGEVEAAPDRRAAAEMVLIRLCHVADLPPPGDLVRRLSRRRRAGGRAAPPAAPPPAVGGGGARAVAGGAARSRPRPAARRGAAARRRFRDVAALVAEQREAMLHAHLVHSVHLVRFAPPVIELRPQPDAPRDLAPKLGGAADRGDRHALDHRAVHRAGRADAGRAGNAADAARRAAAADHPLVRAILEAFPGARIETVHDASADAYGLPATVRPACDGGRAEMPEFAPPDAEPSDEMEQTNEEPRRPDEAGRSRCSPRCRRCRPSWRRMEIDGEAGAGLVRVTLNGKGELRRIKIDPKLVDPADTEMLEDLIVAAHRDAKGKIEAATAERDAEGDRRAATAARDEAAVLTRSHVGMPLDGHRRLTTDNCHGRPRDRQLIGLLAKLPGMGPRSARRAALKLLQQPEAPHAAAGGRRWPRRRARCSRAAVRQPRQPRSVRDLRRSAARPVGDLRGRGRRRPVGAGARARASRAVSRARRHAVGAGRRSGRRI